MKKTEEKGETPDYEAKSHSKGFLKKVMANKVKSGKTPPKK